MNLRKRQTDHKRHERAEEEVLGSTTDYNIDFTDHAHIPFIYVFFPVSYTIMFVIPAHSSNGGVSQF